MVLTEFDEEKYEALIRAEGREEGIPQSCSESPVQTSSPLMMDTSTDAPMKKRKATRSRRCF